MSSDFGLGNFRTVGQALTAAALVTLNATSPTYTCPSGSFDPVTNTIKYPNQRRQKTITIAGTSFSADLLEGQRINLLGIGTSERFTVTWTTGTGSPTVTDAATTSVTGETDAASFVEGSANGEQSLRQSITKAASSLAYAAQIRVKNKSGSRSVVVELDDGTTTNGVSLTMNPSTGAIVSAPAAFGTGWAVNTAAMTNGYTITDDGSGWYRVALAVTSDATTTVRFRIALYNGSTTSYAGDSTSGVYLWGADVGQANWAASYVSNRNCIVQSETFDIGSWGKTRSSISANAAANPLTGDSTADSLVEDNTASNTHFTNQSFTKAASSLTFTLSVYAKAGGRSWILLAAGATAALANGTGAYFDLTNGATGSTLTAGAGWATTAKSITSLGNGWYRCQVTLTTDSTAAIVNVIRLATADNTSSYSGNGTGNVVLYGYQLEYGSAATTYWATTTASVRNVGLLLSGQGLNSTQGTMLGLMIPYGWSGHFNNSTAYRVVSSQGTAQDGEIRGSTGGASNSITATRNDAAASNNSCVWTASPTLTDGSVIQLAFTWNAGGTASFTNGTLGSAVGAAPTLPYNNVTGTSVGPNSNTNQPNAYVLGLVSTSTLSAQDQQLIYNSVTVP